MTDPSNDDRDLDARITRIVAEAAADAPDAPEVRAVTVGATPAHVTGTRRRRHLTAVAAGFAAATALVVALVARDGGGQQIGSVDVPSSSTALDAEHLPPGSGADAPSTTAAGDRTQIVEAAPSRPIGSNVAASCVELYDLATITNRSWAFDGTVVAITTSGDDTGLYADVEFDVHEWFAGDGPRTVSVELIAPTTMTSVDAPDYAVGSRLLVSGEPRWGGNALDSPVAWTCGFTRTYDELTAAAWREAFDAHDPTPDSAPASTQALALDGITRPIVAGDTCEARYARDGVTKGVSLFARTSTNPVPIQIVGDAIDGPAGSFAMVQRYFGDDWRATGQEAVDLGGTTYWVSTHANGNGSVEWDLADGSQGYVRSRGLGRDDLVALVGALTPRTADAAVPGFDFAPPPTVPANLQLLHEQMNTDVAGEVHRSACEIGSSGSGYRISAISGDPIFEYGGVIDRPAPLSVGSREGTVIVIDGPSDPAAPTVDDIVDADPAMWNELLTRLEWPAGAVPRFEVNDREAVVVELRSFDEHLPPSTLTLRLVEERGAVFLEVETAGVVLDPDAVLWKTRIEGRGGGLRTATVGGVQGYRVGEAPLTGEVNVEISVIDGGDFVLQTTGQVQLIPLST